MEDIKITRLRRFLVLLVILVALFSSCKKDKDIPTYIGDWLTQKPIPASAGYVSVTYYLNLSVGNFTESFIEVPRSPSYNNMTRKYVSIEGSISVHDSIMNFIPQKITFSNYDITTSTYSKPYQTFTRDKDNIDGMISGFILVTAGYKVKYSIQQNKLSIAVDYNGNEDFSDDHNPFLYTKQ